MDQARSTRRQGYRRSGRGHRLILLGLGVNAGLMLAVLVALLGRDGGPRFPDVLPAAHGQFQAAVGGGAGVFVVPAQFSTNTYGCYIMDVDAQTLVAYQFLPAERQMKLVSARHFRHDRRLQSFNIAKPSPDEVRQLVEQAEAGGRGADVPQPEPRNPEVQPPGN